MKKMILVASMVVIAGTAAKAQGYYGSGHYYPSTYGVNGFRTAEEENAFMEQMLAERRRKMKEENTSPEERKLEQQQMQQQQHIEAAAVIRKNVADNKNKRVARL